MLASAAADAECRIGTRPPSSGLTGAKSGSVSRTRVVKSDNVALSVLSVAGWHLEAMTSQEPGTAAEPTTTAGDHDAAVDSTPPSRRQSRWSKLNRTNRIAAFVLGGVASVFVAALIFGAGVLVGAEFGDSEGHHRGSETADYGTGGGDGSGEHEGSGSEGDGRPWRRQRIRGQPRSRRVRSAAPTRGSGVIGPRYAETVAVGRSRRTWPGAPKSCDCRWPLVDHPASSNDWRMVANTMPCRSISIRQARRSPAPGLGRRVRRPGRCRCSS